jgi:hypothetical protein
MFLLIGVSIPTDRIVVKEETLKYKNLLIETQRTWNVKAKVTRIIIGATGSLPRSFLKH